MIRLDGLTIRTRDRVLVDGITLSIAPGECVALIGPSGAGKSLTARSLLGLLPDGITATARHYSIDGEAVVGFQPTAPRSGRSGDHAAGAARITEGALRPLRGRVVSFIPQEAQSALDPLRRVGSEVAEPLRVHRLAGREEAWARAVSALAAVGLDAPELRARQYPWQLSGGQRQRALLASAQITAPGYLVADEPTTALDPLLRADLIAALRARVDAGLGVLLISHDLATAARIADRVIVLDGGRIVEQGPTERLLGAGEHPVTQALAAATRLEPLWVGAVDQARSEDNAGSAGSTAEMAVRAVEASAPALTATGLTMTRTMPDGSVRATLQDVGLSVRSGSTLGVVGASGSGKTTLARLLLALESPTAGEVLLGGEPWSMASERTRRPRRRQLQAIAQDPLAVLNPRWSAARSIAEALPPLPAGDRVGTVRELLRRVGLDDALGSRRPGQLSGGQRQRVAIARALATGPRVLIADEPIAALDPPAQDAILRLLADLRDREGLALVLISHDLAALLRIADDLLVLADGQVVEYGPAATIVADPQHPATRDLLTAVR